MKRLSLQWRITLMTVLLIGVTCVVMNLLLCSSGVYYMDTIADTLQGGDTVMMNSEGAESFNPQLVTPDEDLTIVVNGAQGRFRMTNWYITAVVTLLSGVLAYFVSGRALKPLRSFVSQVEKVQLNNLADMRINEDVLPEFRQLSYSFNQMLERLDNAFAAQRQFTGNAAHELRTPLTIIVGYLENLMEDDLVEESPALARKFIGIMHQNSQRLMNIIEDMLMISKLESGHKAILKEQWFHITSCVDDVFSRLDSIREKKQAALHMDIPPDWELYGDPFYWTQVLFNLVENALKQNTKPGLSVTVAAAKTPEACVITVTDTGVGIPAESLPFLFNRFYRVETHHSSEIKGTGLGLSIVKRAVEAHDGTITVTSVPHRETAFTITIPLKRFREGEEAQRDGRH